MVRTESLHIFLNKECQTCREAAQQDAEILRARTLSSAWTKARVLLEGSVGTAHSLLCGEWAGQGDHEGVRPGIQVHLSNDQ